jgi:hypothetical protein
MQVTRSRCDTGMPHQLLQGIDIATMLYHYRCRAMSAPNMPASTRRHTCLFLAQFKHRLKAPQFPFVFVIRKENRMFPSNLYARPNLKVLL